MTRDTNPRRTDAQHGRTETDAAAHDRRWSVGASTSRRGFLRAVGAGAVVATVGTGDALGSVDSMEFLDTDGTEFVLGDRPVYFNGTNNFWIADPYESRQRVDEFMSICEALNLNLVRTWAFCSGEGGHCLQPEPGVYDEAGFQHLDYIIAAARAHGVRLVLALVNNWSDYGGMDQYVSWSSTASSHDDFYTDSEAQQLYHDFVEYVVTRENSITGVEYRNEPAIAIWELANEPRAKQASDGIARVTQWIEESSALIKELDSNHLVSTGMEGFYDKGGDDWRHDGSHGTAFIDQHQIDTIDACSFHLYPDHWPGIDPTVPQDGVDWITEHVGDAFETVGKPVYLGEFGISLHENSQTVRDEAFSAYYDALDQYDANGAMLWEIVRDSQSNHDGYAVYQDESSMSSVNDFTATQYEKSGGDGSANGGPYADATGPNTLRIGETGSFDASLSFDPEQSLSSYSWAFGDGATASGERASHRYGSTGSHTVELTVTDDQGASASDTETVSVEDLPSGSFLLEGAGETVHETTKQFHYAYVPISGEFALEGKIAEMEPTAADAQAGIMTLDAVNEPGPLGAVTVTPGEGTELTRAYTDQTWRERTGDSRSPPLWLRLERTARDNGDFDVTGWVSEDGSSWTEINTGAVDMADQAYVGLYVSSNSPSDLCTVQFDGIEWLDSWQATDIGSVAVAGHTTEGAGGDTNQGPTASIDPSATTVQPDTEITFDGSGSTDADGSISSYEWTFGDGESAAGESVTHAYAATGEYTVTLTVTDGDGATDEASVIVTVTESSAPTAPTNLSVTDTTQTSVSVAWDASTDADGDLDQYAVSVDGSQNQTVPAGTTQATVSELSAETSYEIGVTAVDSAGNESEQASVTATTDSDEPTDALVINDYDGSPAWSSNTNDLGQWCGAGSFENGGGTVSNGALTLEYDNGGWFQEQINQEISDYQQLVVRVRGANGGEQNEILFDMGGVRTMLANVTDDSITTSYSDVTVDLQAAGVDRSASSLSIRLNFWQGGSSTLEIEEIALL